MGRYRLFKNSFLGGQISRDALGRTDIPQNAHSCELLQNMIPITSGGAYRRPGSLYQDFIPANIATANSGGVTGQGSSSPPRIFPFIVSQKQAYAVVIGTMRWSELQSNTVNPNDNPGGAYMSYYQATTNSSVPNGSGMSNIQFGLLPYRCKSINAAATATDQCYYTRQGGIGAVANSGSNTAGSPVTIIDVADYLQTYDDDIWSVQFCQANDVMFLTHPDYQPQVIYLNSSGAMEAVPYDYDLMNASVSGLSAIGVPFGQTRPYMNQNTTGTTMAMSWSGSTPIAGGTGTLTASTNFFNTLHAPRAGCLPEGTTAPTDGAIIAVAVDTAASQGVIGTPAGGIVFCYINSITSATVANVTFVNGISQTNYSKGTAVPYWWESAWSNYRGWPAACAIYQQRLCFASTKHQPNALWFTGTDAYGAPVSSLVGSTYAKFSALNDTIPQTQNSQPITVTLANGQTVELSNNWYYARVDDSQGDGQSTGPNGSQPFRISLATTSLDAIQYISPDQQLFLGTATQEWVVAPENGSFDVANSTCTIQSHYGSDYVQALRIGYELMFVLQSKCEVRAYQYNYFDQSFFGEPVQLFFDEYPISEDAGGSSPYPNPYAGRRKIRQMDWDSTRSVLWCIDTNGSFFGLTRDRKLAITAWHTHQMGGFNASHGQGQNMSENLSTGNYYTDSGNFLCDGSVVSLCTTPNPLSGIRDIWLVVKRSVGSNTIYSIERMVGANTVRQSAYSDVAPGNAQEPVYTDCTYFLTDNGSSTDYSYQVGAQLSGQSLVGTYYSETYGMFAIAPQAPVASNGDITLQTNLPPDYGTTETHTMVVGLGYTSAIQPVRADPPSPVGTSQGAIKRNSKAYVRLFKTLFMKAGSPPTNPPATGNPNFYENVQWAQPSVAAGSPEIYTGDKEVFLPATYDRDGYVYLLQDQPLPFTVVSISVEGTEYEQG